MGYGPVGRIVHQLLTDRGADVAVVDLNLETVRALRERGVKAVYAMSSGRARSTKPASPPRPASC